MILCEVSNNNQLHFAGPCIKDLEHLLLLYIVVIINTCIVSSDIHHLIITNDHDPMIISFDSLYL